MKRLLILLIVLLVGFMAFVVNAQWGQPEPTTKMVSTEGGLFLAALIVQIVLIVILLVAVIKISKVSQINNNLERLQDLVYQTSLAQLYVSTQGNRGKEYNESIATIQEFMDGFPEFSEQSLNRLKKALDAYNR